MAGMQPLSPQSGITARVARIEEKLEQFQQSQGMFASQMNTEIMQTNSRMATIETTIRDREEAIKVAFDHTAAQRAA